jgi:hypothetical protein
MDDLKQERDAVVCWLGSDRAASYCRATGRADRDLARRHELLVSIPDIGTATAATILAELPDIRVLRAAAK